MSALDDLFGVSAVASPSADPYLNKQIPLVAPEHKGLFGIKGGLRNFLGTLGDGLAGNNNFARLRQQEREGDALINFGMDPLGAVQNLMAVNPEKGMELQDNLIKQRNAEVQNAALAEYRKAQMEALKAARTQKGLGVVAGYLGAFDKDPRAPDSYKQALPGLRKVIEEYDLSDIYDLPDEYDRDTINRLSYAGMNPSQQAADEDRDTNLASTIADRNARQGLARERLNLSRQDTASKISDRDARRAETRRYHDEQTHDRRNPVPRPKPGKPGRDLVMPPGAPPLPKGKKYELAPKP